MRKQNNDTATLSKKLGYNPYRDTQGRFDDGPQLLETRGRPMVPKDDNRKKIDAAKKKLEEEFNTKALDSSTREKVIETPELIKTPGFDMSTMSSEAERMIIRRDKQLFPDQTYGEYYKEEKHKVSDVFMITPAEYRQALLEAEIYKDIDHLEGRMEQDKIDRFTNDMLSGDKFPLPVLEYNEKGYSSQEGLHRVYAAENVGIEKIPVVITSSTDNQDIYPYNNLKGSILSQDELFSGESYGDGVIPPTSGPVDDSELFGAYSEVYDAARAKGGEITGVDYEIKALGQQIGSLTSIQAEMSNEDNTAKLENLTQERESLVNKREQLIQEYEALRVRAEELYKQSGAPGNTGLTEIKSENQGEEKTKPGLMTEEEAKKATENSALAGKIFYHGTDASAGEEIANNGFAISTGENQIYGEGIYMTDNAIEAQGYATMKSIELNQATTVASYIDAKNVSTSEAKPPMDEMVMERLVAAGVVKEGEKLSTFEQFKAWDDSYKEVIAELLQTHDVVEIPATDYRPEYILVKDPSIIKTFQIDNAKKVADEYFEGLQNE